jgi:predicted CoA-binding protein
MTDKKIVDNFLSQLKFAVVGVSRSGKKFGNAIFRELKSKDYQLFAVNPYLNSFENEQCYPNLSSLPEAVDGVIIVVPPEVTEKVVKDAHLAKIKMIWMQQGSESDSAIQFCREHGIEVIHGECILMFAEPVAFLHRMHRWVWKILGKLPQ